MTAPDTLVELAEAYEKLPPTKNPWPEDSDFGKLWRKGYEAGVFDERNKRIAASLRAVELTHAQAKDSKC